MFTSKISKYLGYFLTEYGYDYPILKVSVDHVNFSSDYVTESDKGNLRTLEVIARTDAEYLSFFKKVKELMSWQCDCPAGSDDLQIHLSPVFRVTLYRCEEEFLANKPRTHTFIKFHKGFYKHVNGLRRKDY